MVNRSGMMKRAKVLFFSLLVLFAFVFVGTVVRGAEPVNVELTAYFDESNEVKSNVETFYGREVSFSSDLPTNAGYEFAFWVLNGKVISDDVNYSFTVTENTKVKAIFKPTGKKAVVFMDTNDDVLKVQYVNEGGSASDEGIAFPTKPGYQVKADNKWDKPLTGINADTIVTLQYEKTNTNTYTLTVVGGTGSKTAEFNEVVTVNTNPKNGDFKYWKVGNQIVSYQSTYSFTMFSDVTITAVYEDYASPYNKPTVSLSEKLSLRDDMNTFVGQYYLPQNDDYSIIEYGILTSNTEQLLTLDTFGVKKYQGGKVNDFTKEYMMSVPESSSVSARAYLVYKDDDEIKVVYNEFEQEESSVVTPSDLFFSAYVEGSSNNKAIAIYNGTGATVDLSNYSIKLYANGKTTVESLLTLSGHLESGEVYIIANTQSGEALLAFANITHGVANFNGDDALGLYKNDVLIDSFGQIGFDPGSAWNKNGVSTENKTLVRKATVISGDTNGTDVFDPSLEWDAYPIDTFDVTTHQIVLSSKDELFAEINEHFNNFGLNNYSNAKKQDLINAYETGIAALNAATTSAQISSAVNAAKSAADAVLTKTQEYNAAKNALVLPPDIITEGITVTETYNSYITYQWTISPEGIIEYDGSYINPDEDTDVTFTIDILIDGEVFGAPISKTATVKALMNSEEYYNEAVSHIENSIADGEDVRGNVSLPTSHPIYDVISIVWQSSHPGIIAADGTFNIPTADTVVTLTATVQINGSNYGDPIVIQVVAKKLSEQLLYETGFESASKSSYSFGTITSEGREWCLENALIGNSESDRRNGSKSIRAQASGSVYMQEGMVNITKIEAYVGTYGSDTTPQISIKVSKNGVDWVQVLAPMTPGSTLELISVDLTASAAFENAGLKTSDSLIVKFEISGSKRINIDDVKIYGYA